MHTSACTHGSEWLCVCVCTCVCECGVCRGRTGRPLLISGFQDSSRHTHPPGWAEPVLGKLLSPLAARPAQAGLDVISGGWLCCVPWPGAPLRGVVSAPVRWGDCPSHRLCAGHSRARLLRLGTGCGLVEAEMRLVCCCPRGLSDQWGCRSGDKVMGSRDKMGSRT